MVNWGNGSIEIGWMRDATIPENQSVAYDVYWSTQTNGTDHLVKKGVYGRSCVDSDYLGHSDGDDGICPIYYTVVGADGSRGCCLTRRRYGLFVGYSEVFDGKDYIPASAPYANSFWNQFLRAGGLINPAEDAVCKIDATKV